MKRFFWEKCLHCALMLALKIQELKIILDFWRIILKLSGSLLLCIAYLDQLVTLVWNLFSCFASDHFCDFLSRGMFLRFECFRKRVHDFLQIVHFLQMWEKPENACTLTCVTFCRNYCLTCIDASIFEVKWRYEIVSSIF